MAYRKFDTKNANYILGLMDHGFENNLSDALENNGTSRVNGLDYTQFENLDGYVIEVVDDKGLFGLIDAYFKAAKNTLNGNHEEGELLYSMGDPRYPIFADNFLEKPIYGTDIRFGSSEEDKDKSIDRRMNSLKDHIFLTWVEFYGNNYLVSKNELSSFYQHIMQRGFHKQMDARIEGRNAINAEKIESFVVDRVSEISGKEKPTIGLIYGAHHLGIEQCLKSKKRREKVIKKMREHEDFDAKKFNEVQEVTYDKLKALELKIYNSECF